MPLARVRTWRSARRILSTTIGGHGAASSVPWTRSSSRFFPRVRATTSSISRTRHAMCRSRRNRESKPVDNSTASQFVPSFNTAAAVGGGAAASRWSRWQRPPGTLVRSGSARLMLPGPSRSARMRGDFVAVLFHFHDNGCRRTDHRGRRVSGRRGSFRRSRARWLTGRSRWRRPASGRGTSARTRRRLRRAG